MLFFAKDCEPGRRVKTKAGVHLEAVMAGSPPQLMTRSKDGAVCFWVLAGGLPTREYVWVPAMHQFPGARKRVVKHSGVVTRGRPPLDPNCQWRGWAIKHAAEMDGLLATASGAGMRVSPHTRYFAVAAGSANVSAVFRNGVLGFMRMPEGPLGAFPRMAPGQAPMYHPYRIDLPAVHASGQWEMLKAAWLLWLKGWAGVVVAVPENTDKVVIPASPPSA